MHDGIFNTDDQGDLREGTHVTTVCASTLHGKIKKRKSKVMTTQVTIFYFFWFHVRLSYKANDRC